ncbi:MAG: diguanylate cyclase [candidate division WOR-3 bacterium]
MDILIVDDSEDQLVVLKSILNEKGYNSIHLVSSAEEAFDFLGMKDKKKNKPNIDLILMDIIMPKTNGIEACSRIKKEDSLKDTPIIMITANREEAQLQAAFQSGAIDYITKPINITELLARVRSALRLKMETDSRKERERELTEMAEQLDAANKKLTRMSYQDGLTGVPNRRYFEEFFAREWKNAIRLNSLLSLIMFDIDCFKAYNDTYGHLNGDDCLAKRFLKEINKLKIVHKNSTVSKNVTISVGVVTINPDRKTKPTSFINKVDKALYEAKQSGRNCIKEGSTT